MFYWECRAIWGGQQRVAIHGPSSFRLYRAAVLQCDGRPTLLTREDRHWEGAAMSLHFFVTALLVWMRFTQCSSQRPRPTDSGDGGGCLFKLASEGGRPRLLATTYLLVGPSSKYRTERHHLSVLLSGQSGKLVIGGAAIADLPGFANLTSPWPSHVSNGPEYTPLTKRVINRNPHPTTLSQELHLNRY